MTQQIRRYPLDSRTPAQLVGCCLATSKEFCNRPPCPCNLDAWSAAEKKALAGAIETGTEAA